MKAKFKLQAISKLLNAAGIESPAKEAEFILRHALNLDLVTLYRDDPELTDEQEVEIEKIIARRNNREPLQYIFGHVEFMGLKILVGKGVLVPRPETELMAEYAIKKVRSQSERPSAETRIGKSKVKSQENTESENSKLDSSLSILDLCTGSGCLALALAREFPEAQVYGLDISETAIGYARGNAVINGISNVTFLEGPLFGPLEKLLTFNSKLLTFDLIISNPPYIRTDAIKELQPEIRDWEPVNALDGGADGLDFYRVIISSARQFLKNNGILMFELGDGCADEIEKMFERAGYKNIVLQNDYAGIGRIISAEYEKQGLGVRV